MRGDAVLSESCVRTLKPCREVRSMTSRPPIERSVRLAREIE
jgi:hypothetical protein